MGIIQKPFPVTLLLAVMFNEHAPIDDICSLLTNRFGEIDESYGPVSFSWTSYYGDEMGANLRKTYIFFKQEIARTALPSIKCYTNDIERQYLENGNRTVNLDPGYIARDKLVLASTKDFYHRLYLGDGIYGEVTLHYRKGIFRHFSWTYPDYKESELHRVLQKVRGRLVKKMRDNKKV